MSTRRNKYEALELHLRSVPHSVSELNLSFKQIEKILGVELPMSAKSYQAWWANQTDTTNRSNAQAWLSAGFEVDVVTLNKTNGHVRFKRTHA